MTPSEALSIIRKEYLCVDRDCDIERSCGKCDLMMPSKEPILQAYKMAIQALETQDREQADRDYISCIISEIADIKPYSKDFIGLKDREELVEAVKGKVLGIIESVAIPKERGE